MKLLKTIGDDQQIKLINQNQMYHNRLEQAKSSHAIVERNEIIRGHDRLQDMAQFTGLRNIHPLPQRQNAQDQNMMFQRAAPQSHP